jgi:hypothetical protein
VAGSAFVLAGIAPAPVYADYEWLQRKHPEHYATQEAARADVEFVLAGPDFAAPGNRAQNVIFDRAGEGNVRVALRVELLAGAYHVRSVHRISEEEYQKDKGRRFSPDSYADGSEERLGPIGAGPEGTAPGPSRQVETLPAKETGHAEETGAQSEGPGGQPGTERGAVPPVRVRGAAQGGVEAAAGTEGGPVGGRTEGRKGTEGGGAAESAAGGTRAAAEASAPGERMGTARIDSPEEARRLLEGLGEAPGRAPGPGTALAAVEPPGASQGPARRAEPATDGQGRGEGEGKAAAEAGVPAGDRRAVEEQMAAVPAERDAEGRLTAPNGKPSGLEERLWRLARTAWFRARHGDWLTLARIGAVRELGAIPVPEAGATREQSRSMYRALGAVTAADGRRVELVNAAFGKLERHRDGARILRLVPKLRELFAAAVPAYSEKEREPDRHRNVVAYHNYVGKARIAGREYYVRFTVQEVRKADGSELHNAALSDIEMTEAAAAGVHSRIKCIFT